MSEPRAHLVAVPDSDAAPAVLTETPERGREPRWVLWGVIVLLLCAVIAFAAQTRRVGALEDRVAGLGAELAASQASLAAYQERFVEVRLSVGDLRERLAALDVLVSRDPAPAPVRAVEPVPTP